MFNSASSAAVANHKKGRVPRALREEQILDIAQELFLTKGYDEASIEDICRIAQISRPTVYSMYANKAAIYLACVRRARAILERDLVKAATSTTDPYERLVRGGDAYFRILEDDPMRWELLFGKTGMVGEVATDLAAERSRTVAVIAALLREYAPDTHPDRINAYANMISGAAEQLGRWWANNRQIDRETISRYHAEFLWSGGRDLRDEPAQTTEQSGPGGAEGGT